MTTREAAIALICLIVGGTIGAAIICCCVAAGREDRRMEQPRRAEPPGGGEVMACKNCYYFSPYRLRRWRWYGTCDLHCKEVKAYSYHTCGERRWPKR